MLHVLVFSWISANVTWLHHSLTFHYFSHWDWMTEKWVEQAVKTPVHVYADAFGRCAYPLHPTLAYLISPLVSLWELPGSSIFNIRQFIVCFASENASQLLLPKHLSRVIPLMYSFLILSILISPKENLDIFISVTSSYTLLSASVSKAYSTFGPHAIF